eukprot:scaffold1368_cov72-Skeletonema_marinoi.AAC.4
MAELAADDIFVYTGGEQAFYGCTSLTDVEFGDKLEIIGSGAFCHCPIKCIKIPTLRIIEAGANYCSLHNRSAITQHPMFIPMTFECDLGNRHVGWIDGLRWCSSDKYRDFAL